MPWQPDLLSPPGLEIKPELGRSEPRLWVRRLVVWSEPGKILRQIVLHPGLNIIWSPDRAEQDEDAEDGDALGHGSGKTLFCRLLRYCLGEPRFCPDDQRTRVAHAFPEGMVGAEVMLEGTQWAILRPIGNGRKHYAIAGVGLDDLVAGNYQAAGVEPFLEAVAASILSADVVDLMPGRRPLDAWLLAVAWLSRDQECRFDKILDWRSPDSDSGSPARGLSASDTLDVLRALVGALVPAEQQLRAEIGEMETLYSGLSQQAVRLGWEVERLKARLIDELDLRADDLFPGRLAVEDLRRAAKLRLVPQAVVTPGRHVADIEVLRAEADEAQRHVDDLGKTLEQVKARIPEIAAIIRRIEAEMPGSSARMFASENPLCQICLVPIDKALAEGCSISHEIMPNPREAGQRFEQLKRDWTDEEIRLRDNRADHDRLSAELDTALSEATTKRLRLRAAEDERDARSDVWYTTRRLLDDANRLDELMVAHEHAQSDVESLVGQIEVQRELTGSFRDAQAGVFERLSRNFDAIVREIVRPDAMGRVTLDGNGIKLSITLGGERSTAAIESLKVIAFDLAVMCMSIEGGTHLPAFLLHDSPREADLGLSVYYRLLLFARKLEQLQGQPLFQYIVTTTTRPPAELREAAWLVATLGGTPADARLLRRDL